MKLRLHEDGLVSVHARGDTTPEKQAAVLDYGLFVDDLSKEGLQVVLSNKKTFESGEATIPRLDQGYLDLSSGQVEPDVIEAMHVRILGDINVAGAEAIPKLNENPIKQLARSKIELYRQILHDFQVPTQLLTMEAGTFNEAAAMIESIATRRVVVKRNMGSGGYSTRIMEKEDALGWINEQLKGDAKPHLLQPEIAFGRLPADIHAAHQEDQPLVDRARHEGLLYELRSFAIKRHDVVDVVPILRIVPDKDKPMQGTNDDYIDVKISDELTEELSATTQVIMENVGRTAGDAPFLLGAVDYYFDKERQLKVMEANLRSPQLPTTNETPIAGRAVHSAVAKTLRAMMEER